jgi:hypothetical protein
MQTVPAHFPVSDVKLRLLFQGVVIEDDLASAIVAQSAVRQMYVYICIYIYIYTCMYVRDRGYCCTERGETYVCIYMYVCVCVYIYIYIYIHVCMYVIEAIVAQSAVRHMYVYICIYMYIYTCMYVRMRVCLYVSCG